MTETTERTAALNSLSERAREIYERDIKHLVEPEHIGEFLVLDVDTSEYEFGPDEVKIGLSMYNKKPSGNRFGMRMGYRTARTLGGRLRRTEP